jgi:ferritin-like metal-binding protein YciE
MPVQSPEEAFLFDLSVTRGGKRTSLEIIEQGAGEVADGRARTLLRRNAEEARAQIRAIDQVFSLIGAQPQDVRCPVVEGVRQELDMFRQQDPAPQFLTATVLAGNLKMKQNDLATYGLLTDKAMLMGQVQAAQILTTMKKQEEDNAGTTGRLIHEILLETVGGPDAATEVAAAGGGAVPQAAGAGAR